MPSFHLPQQAPSPTGWSAGKFPTLEATERKIIYATLHTAARRAKREVCSTPVDR